MYVSTRRGLGRQPTISALAQVPAGSLEQIRLTVCKRARLAARGHDDSSARLIELLKRPIAKHEKAKIEQRVRVITALFRSLDPKQAASLRRRLNDPGDALARFFDCELDRRFRRRLRKVLNVPPGPPRAVSLAPIQPPPAPLPPEYRTRDPVTEDRQTERNGPPPKPRIHVDPPPPGPRLDPRELLDHARKVLKALEEAGYRAGIVAELAVTIALVAGLIKALSVAPGIGVGKYLAFNVATGKLAFSQPSGTAHLTLIRQLARAKGSPDWQKLENALQRLHRLDERAVERLQPPRIPARSDNQQPRQKTEEPKRRIALLLHGTTATRARQIVADQTFARQKTYFVMGHANKDLAQVFAQRASSRNPKEGGPAIVAVQVPEETLNRLRQLRLFNSEPFDLEDRPELRNRLQWMLQRGGVDILNDGLDQIERLRL